MSVYLCVCLDGVRERGREQRERERERDTETQSEGKREEAPRVFMGSKQKPGGK